MFVDGPGLRMFVYTYMYTNIPLMCCEIFLWVKGYLKIDYIFATVFPNCHFLTQKNSKLSKNITHIFNW